MSNFWLDKEVFEIPIPVIPDFPEWKLPDLPIEIKLPPLILSCIDVDYIKKEKHEC